jgi:uncharacterized repeat protein (TIGR04076 family)
MCCSPVMVYSGEEKEIQNKEGWKIHFPAICTPCDNHSITFEKQEDALMERRDFITTAAVGSVGALAGAAFPEAAPAAQAKPPSNKCRITVLKRTLNDEWNKEYRGGRVKLCDKFQDGQEFAVESPYRKPEGFCDWAWADIRTYIHLVDLGKYDVSVTCCTDGFRPVFFKIERVKS